MNIDPFLIWLEATPFSQWIVGSPSMFVFPGFLVLHAANLMATTKLMVGIVLLSLLGILSHWALTGLERLVMPWRER